jgi:hypothetical protein
MREKDNEEGGGRKRMEEGGGHLGGLALPLGFHPLPLDLLQFQIVLQNKETEPLCRPRSHPTPSSLQGLALSVGMERYLTSALALASALRRVYSLISALRSCNEIAMMGEVSNPKKLFNPPFPPPS